MVRSGWAFLGIIGLLHAVPMHPLRPHPIRLNRDFQADMAWCKLFVSEWNWVSFLSVPSQLPAKELTTDALGSWGCGTWHGRSWFQLAWNDTSQQLPITVKEFLLIILACDLWEVQWYGQLIRCHCDNQVVVASLCSPRKQKQTLPAYAASTSVYQGSIWGPPSATVY